MSSGVCARQVPLQMQDRLVASSQRLLTHAIAVITPTSDFKQWMGRLQADHGKARRALLLLRFDRHVAVVGLERVSLIW